MQDYSWFARVKINRELALLFNLQASQEPIHSHWLVLTYFQQIIVTPKNNNKITPNNNNIIKWNKNEITSKIVNNAKIVTYEEPTKNAIRLKWGGEEKQYERCREWNKHKKETKDRK